MKESKLLDLETAEHVVADFFSALAIRELDAVCKCFAEQLDWYIPGNEMVAPWLGHRRTRREVREFFDLLWANTEALSGRIDHLAVDGNTVITSGYFETRMLKTDKIFKSLFFTEITVSKGKIVKYRLLEDSFGLVLALS